MKELKNIYILLNNDSIPVSSQN